jgi:hypothetical protein
MRDFLIIITAISVLAAGFALARAVRHHVRLQCLRHHSAPSARQDR